MPSIKSPLKLLSLATMTLAFALVVPAFGQNFARPDGSVPLPLDWSSKHVIFTAGYTPEQEKKMENEPRAYATWLAHGNGPKRFHRHDHDRDAEGRYRDRDGQDQYGNSDRNGHGKGSDTLKRDWAVSLGAGPVAPGMSPAKYNFDVNATPSCSADYAVYPINHVTNGARAHILGTFSTTAYWNGTAATVVVTVTPTVGTAFSLTLTPSTTVNTGLNFQVPVTGGITAAATTAATNLAAAINRNLSTNGNALTRFVAIPTTNTVTAYALTAGTRAVISAAEGMSDFSWGTATAGTNGTQANIVAFNNLYAGATPFCTSHTYPTFTFSYASGTGAVATSPTISLDGTEIAYVENDVTIGAIFHVLTLGTGTEIGTCASNTGLVTPLCATAPVIPGSTANSNASDFMLPLGLVGNATVGADLYSSPFINYSTDTAYVGDANGYLYSITPVFNGSIPDHAGGSYPVTVNASLYDLSSPVVDVSGTGDIFVGDAGGHLYNYTSSGTLAATALAVGTTTAGGVRDAPIVDSTNGVGYVISCNSATAPQPILTQFAFTGSALTANATADLNYAGSTTVATGCGAAVSQYDPTPDNTYYTTGISSSTPASNGNLIAYSVNDNGAYYNLIQSFQFTSKKMGTAYHTVAYNATTGASGASPLTEFYGGDVSYTLSSIAQTGTTVTITTPTRAGAPFVVGQVVTIAGVSAGTGGCNAAAAANIVGQRYVATAASVTTLTLTSEYSATFATGACTLTAATVVGPTKDYVFFGTTIPAEVYAFTLPITTATSWTQDTAENTTDGTGGTSSMTVDNDSTDGQASSIYFSTEATSTTLCGATTYCAVKLTQGALD